MKKDRECYVILDLLPSYAEGLTSEATNRLVEEHLDKCKKCKEFYEGIQWSRAQEEKREQETGQRFRKLLLRYRYQMLGLLIGIVVTVLMVAGYIMYFLYDINQTNKAAAHTEQIEDYGTWENYYGISELAIFPAAEMCDGNRMDYYYDCSGSKLYQNCQIYLECQYSKQDYEKEKERLLSIDNQETGMKVRYDNTEFRYPAVYAMLYDMNGCYEYALFFEEECRIVYIYLQGIQRSDLYFETKMLPLYYGQTGYMFETEKEPFSIYPEEEDPFTDDSDDKQ